MVENFGGILAGGLEGVVGDGAEGDEEGCEGGEDEDGEGDGDAVGIALEPVGDEDVCRGPGKEIGDEDPAGEVAGEEDQDAVSGGAQDFTDGDFAGALAAGEGGEAEEAHGGDEDGEEGDEGQDVLEVGFGFVKAVDVVFEEGVGELLVGDVCPPFRPKVCDGLGDV